MADKSIKVLKLLKDMGFIIEYEEISKEEVFVRFSVPVFTLSNYQEFFEMFGYKISDVVVGMDTKAISLYLEKTANNLPDERK